MKKFFSNMQYRVAGFISLPDIDPPDKVLKFKIIPILLSTFRLILTPIFFTSALILIVLLNIIKIMGKKLENIYNTFDERYNKKYLSKHSVTFYEEYLYYKYLLIGAKIANNLRKFKWFREIIGGTEDEYTLKTLEARIKIAYKNYMAAKIAGIKQ